MLKTVLSLISTASSKWTWALLAIAVSYATYLKYINTKQIEQLNVYEYELNRAVDLANSNADKLIENQKNTELLLIQLQEQHSKDLIRVKMFTEQKKDIINVKDDKDGSVAPVITDTFKWMLEQTNSANSNSSGNTKDTSTVSSR